MKEKILLVDDEPALLRGLRRQLGAHFHLQLANGPEEGLAALASGTEFAVVVSDMRMPGMSGLEFLKEVMKRSPETVRVMLTGNSDVVTAVDAVNEGNIFRFLRKPCSTDLMKRCLEASLRQHRLLRAERELIEETLKGSIRVLGETLSALDADGFGRSARTRSRARRIARALELERPWEVEIAAILAELGRATLPRELLSKVERDEELTAAELELVASVPEIGSNLIRDIPRLGEVAEIVRCKDRRFDGSDLDGEDFDGRSLPIGARILKPLLDSAALESCGRSPADALAGLRENASWYDPNVLALLDDLARDVHPDGVETRVEDLEPGQVLHAPVRTLDGTEVVPAGHELTPVLIAQIENYSRLIGLRLPLLVAEPETEESSR